MMMTSNFLGRICGVCLCGGASINGVLPALCLTGESRVYAKKKSGGVG